MNTIVVIILKLDKKGTLTVRSKKKKNQSTD